MAAARMRMAATQAPNGRPWEAYAGVRQEPGQPVTNSTVAAQLRDQRRRSLIDPVSAAAVQRAAQHVGDLASQLPSVNWGQVASETGQRAQAGWNDFWRDPAGNTGKIAAAIPGVVWGATGKPLVDLYEAGRAQTEAENRGDLAAANAAADRGLGALGGTALNAIGIGVGGLVRTPLQGAGLAAGLTAPASLAAGQGNLQERLPQALLDTGGASLLGAGLPLALRRRARPGLPETPVDAGSGSHGATASASTPASRLEDFQTAGVRPTLAATVEGTPAGITKTIAENWLGGATARAGLRRSLADTADRAREMASRVGQVQNPELAGEAVQAGVRRFAQDGTIEPPHLGDPRSIPTRDWSFPAKAEALYNRAFDQLERDERAMSGHVEGPVVSVDNTLRTIGEMGNAISGGESRDILGPNAFLRQMHEALQTDVSNHSLSFRDLRSWRTRLRDMMSDPGLRGDTSSAALQRVYGALTRDINATAQNIGGQAAVDLPRIDQFYRAGSRRIETALEPFNTAGGGMGGGRQAYRRIIALASKGPQQNSRQLNALASSLRPDEMRSVAATLLDEMGSPLAGKPGALEPGAFSAATFATNWARLSEAGKAALFPQELRRELDALARVADYQRQVEAMSNHSMTGVRTQNIATTGGLSLMAATHNPMTVPAAIGAIGGMNLTGEMLTNPHFVRWLTHAAQARADGLGVRRSMASLARAAARDPALIPAYNQLVRAQSDAQRGQPEPVQ